MQNIVNGFQPVTIFAKSAVLDVWQGSGYASYIHNNSGLQKFMKEIGPWFSYRCETSMKTGQW